MSDDEAAGRWLRLSPHGTKAGVTIASARRGTGSLVVALLRATGELCTGVEDSDLQLADDELEAGGGLAAAIDRAGRVELVAVRRGGGLRTAQLADPAAGPQPHELPGGRVQEVIRVHCVVEELNRGLAIIATEASGSVGFVELDTYRWFDIGWIACAAAAATVGRWGGGAAGKFDEEEDEETLDGEHLVGVLADGSRAGSGSSGMVSAGGRGVGARCEWCRGEQRQPSFSNFPWMRRP